MWYDELNVMVDALLGGAYGDICYNPQLQITQKVADLCITTTGIPVMNPAVWLLLKCLGFMVNALLN